MRPIDDPEVAAWLSKARADLKMSELAIGADTPMCDQACFHAQQCAEKALKALLVACDLDVPRSHDLVFLVDRLKATFPSIEALAEEAALLTQHGVAPRYPSYLFVETDEDARTAMSHAETIQRTVRALFPE